MNCQRRIIPARAGPTVASLYIMPLSPDHPRSCGANEARHWPISDWSGSIPARAGPTTARARPRCARTDHPRSCGANAYYQSRSAHQSGSSPLVRGQRRFYHSTQLYGRIIPARAGPTSPCPLYRVVPELLRTLVFARPCGGDQFAAGTVSPSLDMSR